MYFKFVPHIFEFWNGLYSQERSQYLGEINIYLIIKKANIVWFFF